MKGPLAKKTAVKDHGTPSGASPGISLVLLFVLLFCLFFCCLLLLLFPRCVFSCFFLILGRHVYYLVFWGGDLNKIGQNGAPGRREVPWSITFDDTSRIRSVRGRTHFLNICCSFCVFLVFGLPSVF